ncbi:hypothetical protein EPUS_03224 [Endocarpon pusillum Z07020]|uniref:DUF6594 domain-containing protein n=1 Tax=Endocarpon pusillum (strain Z07020 / HMAS-L-300199) TaxID=1263415 RepID=U1HVU5_ENDPU|nr:uncharacterized protein EPUS_03224 [Endocarpon pusillum Z07020]ERF74840.1 hypothetical protein EPUS_03224 [Endocarpon pusillum Z07020]
MRPDAEKDAVEVKYVHGYPTLAAFIASDPGHSTAIYRRFDFLSARTLLLLQSELVELEAQLRVLDQEDLQNDDEEVTECARDWNVFEEKAKVAHSRAEKRMQLSLLIRAKLKEYSEANSISQDELN